MSRPLYSLAPLGQIANLLTRYQQTKLALQGLNEIMQLPLDRPAEKQFLHRPVLKGDIELQNISFQYPGQRTKALDNVSFKIAAGERVAIIGRTTLAPTGP